MLERAVAAERNLDTLLAAAARGKTFSPGELLALQATVFRYSQAVEVVSRATDKLVGAVKQTMGTAGLTGTLLGLRFRCYDARGWGCGGWSALAVTVSACSTNILHGVDERSANEATAALERAGIGAEKLPDEGAAAGAARAYTIRVARADGTRAVDLLRALGLPHDRRRGFAETYGQPSLIPTPSEERARYVDALAGEIERTLESADGVVSARVHLVLEESDPLAADAKPRNAARAAVLLKARPGTRAVQRGRRAEAGRGQRRRPGARRPCPWS